MAFLLAYLKSTTAVVDVPRVDIRSVAVGPARVDPMPRTQSHIGAEHDRRACERHAQPHDTRNARRTLDDRAGMAHRRRSRVSDGTFDPLAAWVCRVDDATVIARVGVPR
jgi:hypothetical protein